MAGFSGGDFLSILPAAYQGSMGIYQSILGALGKPGRPVKEVPESIKKATDIAENLASGDMPGYGNTKAQIDLSAGELINSAKGSGNLSNLVGDVLAKQNQANLALGTQNAEFRANAKKGLANQLDLQGQYEDKAQNYNSIQKYQEQSNASSALQGAGLSNMFSGLSDIAGVASYKSLYDSMFPKEKKNGLSSNLLSAKGGVEPQGRAPLSTINTTSMNPILFNLFGQ